MEALTFFKKRVFRLKEALAEVDMNRLDQRSFSLIFDAFSESDSECSAVPSESGVAGPRIKASGQCCEGCLSLSRAVMSLQAIGWIIGGPSEH